MKDGIRKKIMPICVPGASPEPDRVMGDILPLHTYGGATRAPTNSRIGF